jgi:hypothetical protein
LKRGNVPEQLNGKGNAASLLPKQFFTKRPNRQFANSSGASGLCHHVLGLHWFVDCCFITPQE